MKKIGIPTQYRGIQFRSRLEAKWAYYLDIKRIRWMYEPLDLAGYIPDFVLETDETQPMLAEVKPIRDIEGFIDGPEGEKIRTALFAWPEIFEYCAFLVLGLSPDHCWMYHFGSGAWSQLPTEDWQHQVWAAASNHAQWKAPR